MPAKRPTYSIFGWPQLLALGQELAQACAMVEHTHVCPDTEHLSFKLHDPVDLQELDMVVAGSFDLAPTMRVRFADHWQINFVILHYRRPPSLICVEEVEKGCWVYQVKEGSQD